MKKFILAVLIVLLVVSQLLLPSYVADQLEANLKEELNSYQELNVEVKSFPAIKLLVTAADQVTVKGQEIMVDGLNIASLDAQFEDLKFKRIEEEWQAVQGKNTRLEIQLTEEDINNHLATKEELDIFKRIQSSITPQQVVLDGVISFFNTELSLQLTGDFAVVNGSQIVFNSDELAVENFLISTSSIEELKDKLQFKLDLKELPLPLEVSRVELKKDQLEILGPSSENN